MKKKITTTTSCCVCGQKCVYIFGSFGKIFAEYFVCWNLGFWARVSRMRNVCAINLYFYSL